MAPASMLGPLVLNKFAHFPEIPNVINGPPERNASYSNEINSSMRVSFVFLSVCFFLIVSFWLGAKRRRCPPSRIPEKNES